MISSGFMGEDPIAVSEVEFPSSCGKEEGPYSLHLKW